MTTHRPHPITGPWPFAIEEDKVGTLFAEPGARIPVINRIPTAETVIYDDPDDALLYDACDRCDEQAANPLLLDHHKIREAWDRMFHVERNDGHYRTVNEVRLCRGLYLAALTVARVQGHSDPWRMVP